MAPSLSHLTFRTPTKSNLYLANSLASAVSEPNLYRLLIFHVPNHMSNFQSLGHNKDESMPEAHATIL